MARVLASVTTGLEDIARGEVADKLGTTVAETSQQRTGSLRLTVPRHQLPELPTLRCLGHLTLLVCEDAHFFSGRKDGAQADLSRLNDLGSGIDWDAAAALRLAMLPPAEAGSDNDRGARAGGGRSSADHHLIDPATPPVLFRVTCKRTTAEVRFHNTLLAMQ